MRVVILNDTHCGARNSSQVFIDYQERFYETVFFPYLLEHGIKTIIHLGDYYEHRKYVNFLALSANRKHFLEKLREYGIKMIIIPGNHDVYYRNTVDLNSLEELLGAYIEDGTITVYTKPTTIDLGNAKMDLIPWLTPDSEEDAMKFLDASKSQYVGGHFEFQGFEMNPGQYCTDGMDVQWTGKFLAVLSGHFHTKNSQNNVHYLGAQFEFNWADVNDPKYFHVLDTDTHELKPIRNHITLYTKILYDDRVYDYNNFDADLITRRFVKVIVQPGGKTNSNMFDSLIARIQNSNAHDLKISESFDSLAGEHTEVEGEFEDTITLSHAYIDNVETVLDKSKLKQMVTELYSQAMSLEP